MVYEVDFAIKVKNTFCTIRTAFIQAISVSECLAKAEEIRDSLPDAQKQDIRIFIGD